MGGMSVFLIISYIFFTLFFSKKSALREFLWKWISILFDKGMKAVGVSTDIGQKGAGALSWVVWVPACLFGFVLLTIPFGIAATTGLGIVVIFFVFAALVFPKPSINPIWSFPKAYLNPELDRFLRDIATEAGLSDIEFRIDAQEGFNAYGYICDYADKTLRYVVFGKDLIDFIQEFDTPENPDLLRRSALSFALARELSHINAEDTLVKHNALRFLFPLQMIHRGFNMLKSLLSGTNNLSSRRVSEDGRSHIGYTLLKICISLWQAPFYVLFTISFFPFGILSRKMELRADKKAYALLKTSDTLRKYGMDAEEGIRFFLRHQLESRVVLFRPSAFEASISVELNPVDRGYNLGLDILAPSTAYLG